MRIPVAVFKSGNWGAEFITCKEDPEVVMNQARKTFPTADSFLFITAEVPVPETAEVEGRVE